MIQITPQIALRDDEISEDFVRSSGAGGQNVNKVSTAVVLRFDVAASPSLTPEIKARLLQVAGGKATSEGVLQIKAQVFRTQERNRQDALERLCEMIRLASIRPLLRRATKPTRGSQQRRLASKRVRSETKQRRRDREDE